LPDKTLAEVFHLPERAPKTDPPKATVIMDAGIAGLAIQRADFLGEWNDPIAPSNRHNQVILH
jgi:hypothetical protein